MEVDNVLRNLWNSSLHYVFSLTCLIPYQEIQKQKEEKMQILIDGLVAVVGLFFGIVFIWGDK